MAQHSLLLLHASRASVDTVAEFYLRQAADLRPVSILDEGIMDDLDTRNWTGAVNRLRQYIAQAVEAYGATHALVTCSALGPTEMEAVRKESPAIVWKIDEPMLETASRLFPGSIGVLATFPATVETASAWLRHFRPDAELNVVCDEEALQALLHGDRETHDVRLLAASEKLASLGVSGIVLAQVSMARLADEIRRRTGLPILESLSTSLAGVRR